VVVLEDAGEFLALDAGQLNGRALSRLLNVGDGVLGQAIRVLILITTNERLSSLHPALTRAGRCLADIEFLEFDRVEIAAWCAVHDIAVPGVSSASLADLYALQAGHDLADERPQFGFRAA
jgi:hypothetical protein